MANFPFHSSIEFKGDFPIINLIPQKGTAFPSSPYDGQLFYRTDQGKLYQYVSLTSTWESVSGSINTINGTAPIVATTSGDTVTISINLATSSSDGAMPAADKAKLDNATSSGTANTLVLRDTNGDATFNMLTITGSPTNATDVATVAYVDAAVTSISWLDPAEFIQSTASDDPGVLTAGKRYVITNTASLHTSFQGITGLGNGDVIEYNGSGWDIIYDASVEGEGGVIYVKATNTTGDYLGDIAYRYNGTNWVEFFNVTVNSTGNGLYESNGAIHVGAGDNSITINPDDIVVNVDNVTLETDPTNGVQVKDGGITYAKINSSVFDNTIVGSGTTFGVANYTVVSGTTVARVYKQTGLSIGGANLSDRQKTITHNLNNTVPEVILKDATTGEKFLASITYNDANNITIEVGSTTAYTIDVSVIG